MKLTDFIPSVKLPVGKKGRHSIETFEVTVAEAAAFNMGRMIHDRLEEGIIPGTYTRLVRDDSVLVMTDSISERRDHIEFIENAWGQVLINGLGLGMTLQPVLARDVVDHVMVVEKEQDVIDLVAPTYYRRYPGRLTIVHADAFEFDLDPCPNVVWNDIWDFIDDRNLPQMDELEDKYMDADWCGSWARQKCEEFEDRIQAEFHGVPWDTMVERLKRLHEEGYKVKVK